MEKMIEATRSQIVRVFEEWDAQAKAEGWPDNSDNQSRADEFIKRIEETQASKGQ